MNKAAELGADYFVVKPINFTHLLEIINELKLQKKNLLAHRLLILL